MKGECIRCQAEPFGNVAGSHSFGSGLYQQAEDFQPIVLRERSQRRDGVCRFHISTNIEILDRSQDIFLQSLKCHRPADCWPGSH